MVNSSWIPVRTLTHWMIPANAKTGYEKEYTLVSLFLISFLYSYKKSEYLCIQLGIQCMHKRIKKHSKRVKNYCINTLLTLLMRSLTILLLLIAFISFIDCEFKKRRGSQKKNCPIVVLYSFANKNKSFIKFVRKHWLIFTRFAFILPFC